MKLDNEFLKLVHAPIEHVWQQIGSDVFASLREAGESQDLTNREAIETAIDANYLTYNGEQEADELIGAMVKEHGYDPVVNFLVKHISLN
jgi:hypothetical protein